MEDRGGRGRLHTHIEKGEEEITISLIVFEQ